MRERAGYIGVPSDSSPVNCIPSPSHCKLSLMKRAPREVENPRPANRLKLVPAISTVGASGGHFGSSEGYFKCLLIAMQLASFSHALFNMHREAACILNVCPSNIHNSNTCGGHMYCVHTLWLSCCFLYHITLLSFPVCMIIHLFLPVLLRMCHVTAHNTLPFVPLLYCPIVTHIHIFPCIRILIMLPLHSDSAYRYIRTACRGTAPIVLQLQTRPNYSFPKT